MNTFGPVIGITAEYNPFHRGHLFQIETLRKKHDSAAIVVALSSNFIQRGLPALTDKWSRARAAAVCGADLVLELQSPFSCSNAGVFAFAAVELFRATGVVTALSFGMEDADKELLHRISCILVQEAQPFKAFLQDFLKKGFSYAQARAEAAEKMCPGAAQLLAKPNNTLALAYAEAVLKTGASFELLPVARQGAGYHDTASGGVMSATGIRDALARGDFGTAFSSMPPASAEILHSAISEKRCCLGADSLWQALRLLLLRTTPEELALSADMTEGIENRFLERFPRCGSFEELVSAVSTRRYPRTRVQRQLMALFMNISQQESQTFQRRGPAYLRPLASTARGRQLLAAMRKSASLPVITKPAALKGDAYAQKLMELEYRSSLLWESLLPAPDWNRKLRAVPALL